MLNYINMQELKTKFAAMISRLHTDYAVSLENITDKIITDPYFDFLETGQAASFIYDSNKKVSDAMFVSENVFYGEINSALYWAGLEYMNIALNCGMPLKQILLLCPLDEMVSHFEIYHEMSDEHLVKEYLENEGKRSILKAIRKKRDYSVSELSLLTGITASTIKYYEKDNENLFNASFENIDMLANALCISISAFRKNSLYVPYTRSLWENDRIRQRFEKEIKEIYNRDLAICYEGALLYFSYESGRKVMKKYIPQEITLRCIRNALNELLYSSEPKELIF